MRPEPLTPGIDWVLDMGGPRLATERDREWPPERGEAVRGRYGMLAVVGPQDGDIGEEGFGSVLRRKVGGFCFVRESTSTG